MCLLCSLKPFTEAQPPECTDLFVCSNPSDPQKRTYGIMQFFRKGTRFPEIIRQEESSREERLMDAIFHLNRGGTPAPETGYYFLEPDSQGGADSAVWLLSAINPLDSTSAVISPECQG